MVYKHFRMYWNNFYFRRSNIIQYIFQGVKNLRYEKELYSITETFVRGMAILDLNENVKEKSKWIKSVCKMMELTILKEKKKEE